MSTVLTNSQQSQSNTETDRAYAWFLENRDEILQIIESDEMLRTLQTLELEQNLPPATTHRFKALYDEASGVSEQEEERYAATWDAYHEALDSDHYLATIARAYGESQRMPLHRRIDATGTFVF
jgi:hypothetical protein